MDAAVIENVVVAAAEDAAGKVDEFIIIGTGAEAYR